MGGKILAIFLIILALGIMLYLYNSGTLQKGVNSLESFAPLHYNSSSSIGLNGVTYISPAGSSSDSGTQEPTPTSTINPADIPAGFTASQLSPYFGQVKINGLSPGPYGQISIGASPTDASATIDVTGWEIRSNRGGEYIPQATLVYDPSAAPALTDIRLKQGNTLNMYSTSAPVNLWINECMGYLHAEAQQFNPSLPGSCPYDANQSQIQDLSGACQNYISSIAGSCQTPDFSNPNFPQNDYACQNYLQGKFTYNSCISNHATDPNFFTGEIRVWTGSSPLDPYHDRVEILDNNGLLVNLYTY